MGTLGYPTTTEEMEQRFVKINSNPIYNTFISELDGKVVGMIGLFLGYRFENNDNYVRIVAFVVAPKYRNQGIGKTLLLAAEKWAKEQEATLISLNSGNRSERKDAHQFYTRRGFEGKATGFYKALN
ncbi:GNAT family N-acetyltransferase [Bacillus taeanensis]|uniref:GNAT family N-acetyltransferase n=2 Tax=Bacillus taeanensis TaxID=273032 RepID=A0A366XPX8_9BACI|nr:GNAT family N-acetyltransferase [Bacillus taeanensis]